MQEYKMIQTKQAHLLFEEAVCSKGKTKTVDSEFETDYIISILTQNFSTIFIEGVNHEK